MLWVSEREDAIVLTVRLVHVHNMLTLMELLSPVIINIPYHPHHIMIVIQALFQRRHRASG